VPNLLLSLVLLAASAAAAEIHVSPSGDDANAGTADRPLRTFAAAQQAARRTKAQTVLFHAGTYYLPETIVITPADSGVTFAAAPNETVVLSGGLKLDLQWRAYRDGILQAETPAGLFFDQLFVNGQRQHMARYPNFDPHARPYNGAAADALSPQRSANWSDPAGGFIHAMHKQHWGGYHYRITGKNEKGEVIYEGGWQNNRRTAMHPKDRFVENIFEELDAPGEWFHDTRTSTLTFFPPANVDASQAIVEVVRLRHLIEFQGSQQNPVRSVSLQGFTFRHTARTFMDVKEPLLRSDWTIYRGGAILFNGAEDCQIVDCELDQLGGNGVFVNNYNRRVTIRGCDIHDTGASAIAFVGDPRAVRNPLFEYRQRQSYASIDQTPGPQTDNYPAECTVEDCLVRHFGVVEKQATGVQISMSMGITVRHCSIYEASRAGINISEGTFGGHLIEFCDVFDTVRETGDHGSFNSWGRDRFWGLNDAPADELPRLARLDAVKTTVLRNNRWRCDHGWDVDLDDGSSNYEIYNNLLLRGGLKLREGFHRRVWNNITVGNTLHPHVWYDNSGDVVTKNIFMGAYRPAGGMPKGQWGKTIDNNLFTTSDADRTKFAEHGCDAHSLVGDPLFVDPARGDYRVREGSPALQLGFENFPMDKFGVQKPALKRIARTPDLPGAGAVTAAKAAPAAKRNVRHSWEGAQIRELQGEEFSAFGVSKDAAGVHVSDVPADSPAAAAGLRTDDLIQSVNGQPVRRVADLLRLRDAAAGQPLRLEIVRAQESRPLQIDAYTFAIAEPASDVNFRIVPLSAGDDIVAIQRVSAQPGTQNQPLDVLHDGKLAANFGPVFGNGVIAGIYKVDLGGDHELAAISTWSYAQDGKRGTQRYALFGSTSPDDPGWDVNDRKKFTPITEVDATTVPVKSYLATRICRSGQRSLGTYRWLVWVVDPVSRTGENTAYQEFQITPTRK
jgi:hypothetical protein